MVDAANASAAAIELNCEECNGAVDSHPTNETAVLVTLHPAGRGKFTASLDSFPLVSRPSSSIIFAACRALMGAGVPDGPARFRYAASIHAFDASVKSIHAAAKLLAADESNAGLRIRNWRYDAEEQGHV